MRYRFNLDTAIATWRQSLKLNRSFLADDLDELENHLRDTVEALEADGLDTEAAFSTAQRTKEIGIRKALGATSSSVVVLLSRDFLKPVALAALFAGVIGWVVASKWASNFAYRADFGGAMFAGCALVMVVIAAVTVSFQAYRAAGADPVSSIRYE